MGTLITLLKDILYGLLIILLAIPLLILLAVNFVILAGIWACSKPMMYFDKVIKKDKELWKKKR
jgi:hypothetical protein